MANRLGSAARSLLLSLAGSDYTPAEIDAGIAFHNRRRRLTDPPGHFDKAGRFEAAERTAATNGCRAPSRRWPYSEMQAARTADHCAEVHKAHPLLTKRVARACRVLEDVEVRALSGHRLLELQSMLKPLSRR